MAPLTLKPTQFVARPGTDSDITACLALLRRSPFAAHESPRLHEARLRGMLETLPEKEELVFVVVEDQTLQPTQVIGCAISVYVQPQFVQRLIAPEVQPRLWMTLAQEHAVGKSPILSRRQIGAGNAGGGLFGFSPFHIYDYERLGDLTQMSHDSDAAAYIKCILMAFLTAHEGNKHRAFFKEIAHARQLQLNIRNGYQLANAFSEYNATLSPSRQLFLIEANLDWVDVIGDQLSPIFLYKPPHLGFTTRQRALLRHALTNTCLKSLASALGISEATVQDHRTAIVQLAQKNLPNLPHLTANFEAVVGYVRMNPQELRPFG
jgi:hypothetical protein